MLGCPRPETSSVPTPSAAHTVGMQGIIGRPARAHAAAPWCPHVALPRLAARARPILASRAAQNGAPHLRRPCQPRQLPVVHAAATFSLDEEMLARERPPARPSPPELPEVPQSSNLSHVLPYLLKLAISDPQLYWRLGAALVAMILSKSAGLAAPVFLKQAIDALGGGNPAQHAIKAAVAALLISGACRIVSSLAKEAQGPLFTPVSQASGRRVSYWTFAHVLALDMQFHLQRRTGSLSRMIERGTRSVAMVFRAMVFTFIPTAIELVLVCGFLARSFTPAVSVLVVATFVGYVAYTTSMTARAAAVRKRVNALDNLMTSKAVDALINYETVKLFTNEGLEVGLYDRFLTGYQQAAVDTEIVSSQLNAGQGVILSGGLTAVLVAATTCSGATFTAGDLVMAQGLLLQLWGPLQFLGWFYRELRQSLVDMDALFNILRMRPAMRDGTLLLPDPSQEATSTHANGRSLDDQRLPENTHLPDGGASSSSSSNGAASSNGVSGRAVPQRSSRGMAVRLEDVHFGYAEDRGILRGVSLDIPSGSSCAIVGPSGSGKSTLLRLLMRMYDVNQGSITMDGINVRDLQQASLRQQVAVVPQDTVLFNDTVFNNVAYGRPGADPADVITAAEMARLDRAMEPMPLGFETMVGERGLKLSGGEKQRVAIARAFLRQPRLLICDEATSALDSATEASIMSSLQALAQGRTSITVAHRLSTVQHCDSITVLSQGRIAEQGTHQQLLAQGGLYADMWQSQAAKNRKQQAEAQEKLRAQLPEDEAVAPKTEATPEPVFRA